MNQVKMNVFYKFNQTILASQWLYVIETIQELQMSKISVTAQWLSTYLKVYGLVSN